LTGGDGLGPLGQAFGAEQLAADGAGEPVLAGIRAEQGSDEGEGAARARRDGGDLVGSTVMELLESITAAIGYWLLAKSQPPISRKGMDHSLL
jgi:hypothetical protein